VTTITRAIPAAPATRTVTLGGTAEGRNGSYATATVTPLRPFVNAATATAPVGMGRGVWGSVLGVVAVIASVVLWGVVL